ncbi:MAG: nicotinate (nicotinamide) nucleotide adenylyltransferase [Candidatus Micrarchaeota archaeon]
MGRKIAVLGGSFNPPHYGHLLVAKEVLKHFDCDEVWLMPCFKQAEEKPIIRATHRLAMTRLAVEFLHNPRIKASDFEVRFLKRKNYTADTVKLLKKRFPKDEFVWVFGSELVGEFLHWGKWRELRKLLPLVIYPRPGFKKPSQKFLDSLKAKLVFMPSRVRKSGISSTAVRSLLLKRDARVEKLVPPAVLSFVRKKKLYGWR